MFDRSWTIWTAANPGANPLAILVPLQLPGGEPKLELTAWRNAWATSFATSYDATFLIFRDQLQAAEVTQRLSVSGVVDALMVVGFAPATVRIDTDLDAITIAALGNAPNPTGITVRISEVDGT